MSRQRIQVCHNFRKGREITLNFPIGALVLILKQEQNIVYNKEKETSQNYTK